MRNLPHNWKSLRLEEVCSFHRGLTYKKKDEVDFSKNAVLRANNVSLEAGRLDLTEIRYIDDQIKIPPEKKVRKGSLLVCMASGSKKHLGKVALIDEDYGYAFGGFMGLLLPNAIVYPKYLYWITQSKDYSDYIMGLSDGANINNLKFSQLGKYQVPLPPLPEQKRIVAILDEAFSGIAIAVANTERNLANAREVFESYLNAVFSQRGNGWEVCRIGDVFRTVTGNTPPKSNAKFYGNAIPFVKPPELLGGPIHSASDGLSEEGAVQGRILPEGSVLVSCIGNLGKIAINTVPVAFNQQINAIVPNRERVIPEFVYFQSLSRLFRDQLDALASGTTVPIVNKSKFNSVEIVLPEKVEQESLLERLREIQQQTQDLELIIRRKAEALTELKQSLLQEAFSGELTAVPQDEIEDALA